MNKVFHDGGPYHIETSPLIRRVTQWTGFHMMGTSITEELITNRHKNVMLLFCVQETTQIKRFFSFL